MSFDTTKITGPLEYFNNNNDTRHLQTQLISTNTVDVPNRTCKCGMIALSLTATNHILSQLRNIIWDFKFFRQLGKPARSSNF